MCFCEFSRNKGQNGFNAKFLDLTENRVIKIVWKWSKMEVLKFL